MQISLIGISHKTAPVAVREHFAFSADELPPLLAKLGERYAGAAVLSTCNRTEIYVASARGIGDPRPIVALLSEIKGEVAFEGAPFFAVTGKEAARHLFRVAAGIESMVIGESEVLGQVRAAFTAATAAGTHTPVLSRLFHTAIRVGRKARAQTNIGRGTMSVSSTAVSLARSALGDLSGKTALVVSAGEAGKLTARTLASSGVSRMLVTSRNAARSAELAAELGGSTLPFERLPDALAEADIVITSTAAPHFLIDRPMLETAMAARPNRPLLLIDIAVPRDVDPAVRELSGVHLHDIDDLQAVARHSMHLRRKELGAGGGDRRRGDRQVRRLAPIARSRPHGRRAALARRDAAPGRARAHAREDEPQRRRPQARRSHDVGARQEAPPRPHQPPQATRPGRPLRRSRARPLRRGRSRDEHVGTKL